MNELSRILIAYDGSACSDAALADLSRAGLPAVADVVVLTVADIIVPPSDEELPDEPAIHISEVERHAEERVEKAIKESRTFAERAVRTIKANFPDWEVTAKVECDSPPWAVVNAAADVAADLIIIGSHKHSVAGGRLILGSTSQRVLYEARCSVRLARCSHRQHDGPVKIIVGYDGSRESQAAVEAVAARSWPEKCEVHLITVGDEQSGSVRGEVIVPIEKLRAAGLLASEFERQGDPAHVLLKEAEEWDADSIFVGTRGLHGFQHLLQGSVSSTIAAHAQCSVEVVRNRTEQRIKENHYVHAS